MVKTSNVTILGREHIFVHYKDCSLLREALDTISLRLNSDSFNDTQDVVDELKMTVQHTYTLLGALENRKPVLHISRQKRGIFNAMGNAINWLTGNMDEEDRQNIERKLTDLEQNQGHLIRQAGGSFETNKAIIEKFNNDINTIRNNTKLLTHDIILERSLFEQLIFFQTVSLQVHTIKDHINQILSSLEFCRLGVTDHSVIDFTPMSLSEEYIIALSHVSCHLANGVITYFVHIPVQTASLPLYCVQTLPYVNHNNKYVKLNTLDKIITTNANQLSEPIECVNLEDKYYCKSIKEITDPCIDSIVNNRKLNCSIIEIRNAQPMFSFKEQCSTIVGFQTESVIVNKQPIFTPESYSLILQPGELASVGNELFSVRTMANFSETQHTEVLPLTDFQLDLETLQTIQTPTPPNFLESYAMISRDHQHFFNPIMLLILILIVWSLIYVCKYKKVPADRVMMPSFSPLIRLPQQI